jgi:hypothetical protein
MPKGEKNMLKAGGTIPQRRQGGAAGKKESRRERRSQEAQASGEVIEAQEARSGLEEAGMPVILSNIVATISSRTGHDFSAYRKSTLIRDILRRMRVNRLLSRQK